jgi:hypothetical protein
MPTDRIAISTSKQDLLAFLHMAATDDSFRKRLHAQPAAALAEHSIFLPASAHLVTSPPQLPSKEAINALIKNINEGKPPAITAADSHWVFLAFLAFI